VKIYVRIGFAIFLSLLLFAKSQGQGDKVNHTTQLWAEVDLSGQISKKLKWQFDMQYSRQSAYGSRNFVQYEEQLTLRPWLHYYPNKHIRISAFMGLWYNFAIVPLGAREYPEYRTAIQFNYYSFAKRSIFVNRFRPELREIQDRAGTIETVVRLRYMFKFQHLLLYNSYDKNSLYFVAFDEVFGNCGSKVTGYRFFDQNRIFVGLGFNFTSDIAIESGYTNQFQQHAHDGNLDMNHNWQLSLLIDGLNVKKKR